MTLKELPAGSTGRITNVLGRGETTKRLMEMGVVPGVDVRVVKSAPFGDPIEIHLLGYNLAIRKQEAATIEVDGK